jgi:hypothetical protein
VNVVEKNITTFNAFTDKVIVYVDVLCTGVVAVVACQSDGAVVVALEWDGASVESKDFSSQHAQPDGFLGSMGERDIFRFVGRERNKFLSFTGPANRSAINTKDIP